MGKNKSYDTEFKIQAVKLAMEIGSKKAADELGIPRETLYGWNKAARDGRIDLGPGAQTPSSAMSLAGEVRALREENKRLAKENRRLKDENGILAEATAFFAASRRKSGRGRDSSS